MFILFPFGFLPLDANKCECVHRSTEHSIRFEFGAVKLYSTYVDAASLSQLRYCIHYPFRFHSPVYLTVDPFSSLIDEGATSKYLLNFMRKI